MTSRLLFVVTCLVLVLAQESKSFVIIDPTTGREVAVEDNPNQDMPGEYLSQNIAISPGDFVRGRTSGINLNYQSNGNDNREFANEQASDQFLDEEKFEKLINANLKSKETA